MRQIRTRRALFTTIAAVAAAVATLIYVEYRGEIAQARSRVGTGSVLVETPCGTIEYAAVGEGPPVLMVHGAGGGFDQGLDFGNALAKRGFRVISVSRFGYLRTPLPDDASPAAQAAAHACLLDALGIRSAAIVAASAGAPSAMQFALRHPQRSAAMVLLVPATFVPREGDLPPMQAPAATQMVFDTALRSDFLFWAATRLAPTTLTTALLATPPEVVEQAGTDEQARAEEILRHILPVSARRPGLLNDAAVTSTLKRYELERIAAPTLVISVADDLFGTYENARYTAAHIPGAAFVGYSKGGHVWIGHNQAVISDISTFLRSRLPAPDSTSF